MTSVYMHRLKKISIHSHLKFGQHRQEALLLFFQTFVWERHREKVPSVEGNTGWGLMGPKITIPKNYNTKERLQETQYQRARNTMGSYHKRLNIR